MLKLFNWFKCRHAWVEKDFKRYCPKCKKRQYLGWKRYPEIGKASYDWIDL